MHTSFAEEEPAQATSTQNQYTPKTCTEHTPRAEEDRARSQATQTTETMHTEEAPALPSYDCAYEEINLESQTPRTTTREWAQRAQKVACKAWKNISAEGIFLGSLWCLAILGVVVVMMGALVCICQLVTLLPGLGSEGTSHVDLGHAPSSIRLGRAAETGSVH